MKNRLIYKTDRVFKEDKTKYKTYHLVLCNSCGPAMGIDFVSENDKEATRKAELECRYASKEFFSGPFKIYSLEEIK